MPVNLLTRPYIGRLLANRWTWRLSRLTALCLLVAMAAWGWHQHAIPGLAVRDPLMYTNLSSHLFWVWWLMGIVFVALLFGRLWCTVCPLGWLSGLLSRIGLRRELPVWLQNFIPVTLVLVVLQLSIYFFAIHRYPDYTAVVLALCLLLTIAAGLIFRPRAFCTLLCPAGAVFGLYARVAPFQLRVCDSGVCASCDSQRCIAEPQEWQSYRLGGTIVYRHRRLDGCPVDLVPAEISDSADCLLCLNCAHNCDKENIQIGFRPWLADLDLRGLRSSETLFFLVLFGMLTTNFSKVYVELRQGLFWLPEQTAQLLGWGVSGYNLLAVLWVALLLPALMLLPGWLTLQLSGLRHHVALPPEQTSTLPLPEKSTGFWAAACDLALPLIPLLLAAHAVLALVKINAKAGYLPFAIADPSGVQSYLAMNVMHTMAAPGVLIPLDILKWLVLLLLLAGIVLAIFAARRVSRRHPDGMAFFVAALVTLVLPSGFYLATVIQWLFVR
jgi:hypothetical protein